MSCPWKRLKGKTDSLTAQYFGQISSVNPSSFKVFPAITFAANFASGTPIALLTNGTVRDARGLTSSTYTVCPFTAYCTFIKPMTFSSRAIACVCSRIVSITVCESVCGGSTIAASPECTPANSMCSRIPPITLIPSPAFSKRPTSQMQSTSTSVASSKNLSTNTGRSGEASTANRI